MRTSRQAGVRRRLRFWARMTCTLALALAGLVVCLACWGLPERTASRWLSAIRSPDFTIEADRVFLRPTAGLRLTGVRLFRRGIVGPAAVLAEEVDVDVRLRALLGRGHPLRRVSVRECDVLLPAFLAGAQTQAVPPRRADGGKRVEGEFVLHVQDCRMAGLQADTARCVIRIGQDQLSIADLHAHLRRAGHGGHLNGQLDFTWDTRDLHGRMGGTIDPRVFLPLFDEVGLHTPAHIVRSFEFGPARARINADFTRRLRDNSPLTARATISLKDAAFRGVRFLRSEATLDLHASRTGTVVRFHPLVLIRTEGSASATVEIESERRRVAFDGISTLDPPALFRIVGIRADDALNAFAFEGNVMIAARGRAGFEDNRSDTDFDATVEGANLRFQALKADRYACRVRMRGTTSRLDRVTADLYGGRLTGSATFEIPEISEDGVPYECAAEVADVDIRALAGDLADANASGYSGSLHASLRMSGLGGHGLGGTARGNGHMTIRGGRVFLMPLFGGFTTIMSAAIPGVDFVLRQTDAKADFTVADGHITTDAVHVRGDVLSLSMTGKIGFDRNVDAAVQVRLMREHTLAAKLLRIVTYPLSKLFEFRVHGPVANPRWYPVNFSRDILRKTPKPPEGKTES